MELDAERSQTFGSGDNISINWPTNSTAVSTCQFGSIRIPLIEIISQRNINKWLRTRKAERVTATPTTTSALRFSWMRSACKIGMLMKQIHWEKIESVRARLIEWLRLRLEWVMKNRSIPINCYVCRLKATAAPGRSSWANDGDYWFLIT